MSLWASVSESFPAPGWQPLVATVQAKGKGPGPGQHWHGREEGREWPDPSQGPRAPDSWFTEMPSSLDNCVKVRKVESGTSLPRFKCCLHHLLAG